MKLKISLRVLKAKRYLKIFNTQEEYDVQNEEVMGKPHVVLLKETKEVIYEPSTTYEMVDLGLPSGIQWAKINVGATKESDPGLFFQWGDTQGYTSDQCGNGEGQKVFSFADYKWCNGSETSMTKYCTNSSYGTVDNKIVLDLEDDGCHVHMGGDWRLPTGTNMQELIDNTNYEYVTIDGVDGGKFTNKTDSSKYIFLPSMRCIDGSFYLGTGTLSWSSSLSESSSTHAFSLDGNEDISSVHNYYRFGGTPLRGVVG